MLRSASYVTGGTATDPPERVYDSPDRKPLKGRKWPGLRRRPVSRVTVLVAFDLSRAREQAVLTFAELQRLRGMAHARVTMNSYALTVASQSRFR